MLHRDIAYTYSVSKRVVAYTVPVLALALLINVPKFLETKIVTETATEITERGEENVTTYSMDVTDLRY